MPPLAPTTTPSGTFVRELRLERGENQTEFAQALGVTQPTVSRVESGDRDLAPEFAWRLVTRVGADPSTVAAYVPLPGYLNRRLLELSSRASVALAHPLSGRRLTTFRHN